MYVYIVGRVHFFFALQMKYGTLYTSSVACVLHVCLCARNIYVCVVEQARAHNSNTEQEEYTNKRNENVEQIFFLMSGDIYVLIES